MLVFTSEKGIKILKILLKSTIIIIGVKYSIKTGISEKLVNYGKDQISILRENENEKNKSDIFLDLEDLPFIIKTKKVKKSEMLLPGWVALIAAPALKFGSPIYESIKNIWSEKKTGQSGQSGQKDDLVNELKKNSEKYDTRKVDESAFIREILEDMEKQKPV